MGGVDWTSDWSETRSGSYTLSWTVGDDGTGNIGYTSYTYSSTDDASWHTHSSAPGEFSDATWDAGNTINTTLSGSNTVSYTGTETWNESHHDYIAPDDYLWDDGYTNPVSGTETVYPDTAPGYGWAWRATSSDSLNFTFHGVTEESANLTESATFRATEFDPAFDVNSFTSVSHDSDLGHVVEDVPGVPDSGSGTDLFHRDETFQAATDATGSGSYVGGSADATFQAVESGFFAVANSYTVTDEHIAGYDEDYQPVALVFNYSSGTTGSGSYTHTHNYHDSGDGLELTLASFDTSGSGATDVHSWGTRNGVPFDDTSQTPESLSSSVTFAGDSGAVVTPTGLEDAFPLRGMTTGSPVFFATQPWPQNLPTTPVRGKPGQIQDWYNQKVLVIGEDGKKKGTKAFVKGLLLTEIQGNNPGGAFPRASGTYTIDNRRDLRPGDRRR